ncbi:MAG: GGDEF domain-containing protein [Chloroflexota bacterium]
MPRIRETWPTLAGVGLGIVTLLVTAGLADVGETFIGIPLRGWIFALLVASVGLAGQLVLSGNVALRRERRLVYAAAEMRELTGRLERLATTDALTGLFNRRIFFEQLGIEFRRSIRYRHPMSVIMADLDRFKDVNDRHGHPFGDLVLSVTAQTLRASVRESDIVARYGGEEFVLMLPETGRDEALVVAEKLRSAIERQEYTNGVTETRITISLGVATTPDCAPNDAEDLVRLADEALYDAKRGGRNRVSFAASTKDARQAQPGEIASEG